jgi:DNA-binding CsgD family transcriptional regulator
MFATETLLERAAELQRIDALLEHARDGAGATLAIEGPAGIGKTELLSAACDRAARAGFQVLRARGGDLEVDMAFGVARQLLDRRIAQATDDERAILLRDAARFAAPVLGLGEDRGLGGDRSAALHGLYWVCSNLAERAPLLLAVDDAQWSDAASLGWLAFLARRIEGVPLAIVVTVRSGEPGAGAEPLRALRERMSLKLGPLSREAVAELVRGAYDSGADDAFCSACHEASAGNPFLLRELLATLRSEQVDAVAAEAGRVSRMASPGVLRSVQHRLERIGEPATAIARAIAVLGGRSSLHDVAALAGVDPSTSARAIDAMRVSGILEPDGPLDFVHPLVRSAVQREIPASALAAAHGRAARLADAGGAGPERVAAHLIAAEPLGDGWVVDRLRAAARAALAAGAPEEAVGYLDRARAEPPAAEVRRDLLFDAGVAALPIDVVSAVEHFAAARSLDGGAEQAAATTFMLAKALAYAGRSGESVAAVAATLAEQHDPELKSRLERELLLWEHCWTHNPDRADTTRRLAERTDALAGDTVNDRALLSLRAWNLMVAGAPSQEALAVARRAVGPGLPFTDPDLGFELPTLLGSVFTYCDEPDRALELYDAAIDELSAHGWLVQLAFGHAHRANVQVRRGALVDAEADAGLAWEMAAELGPLYPAWWYALVNFLQVLLARGEASRALAFAEASGVGDYVPDAIVFPMPIVVRGELRIACGDLERGVEDLLGAGTWMEERDLLNPGWSPWRMVVAPALAATGRVAEARDLVSEAIARARASGAVWALGYALRTMGELERGEAALALLAESVAVLDGSAARLELARSLVSHGAALRRAGRRADARDPLRRGLDLAARCGATGLERAAHEELLAAGARPRRQAVTGVQSLTPSELRVCRLAAEGKSNPEIAQALFVTRRTVESHLASAYRKLAIASRDGLPEALAAAKDQ